MKTLDEKKKLVAMMRAFGQPIDKELVESIRREEELSKKLFGEQKNIVESPLFDVVKEAFVASTPSPPAVEIPSKEELVQQVINVLDSNKVNANSSVYKDKELEGMRRTISEMMQKISTMSWGGGGTGVVRIFDTDDFDRSTVGNGKYMKFQNGWFVMDEINPFEVVHNTTLVTGNTIVRMGNINLYAEQNPGIWELRKLDNASYLTLANSTWTSVHANSAVEYNITGTAINDGEIVSGGFVGTTSPGGSAKGFGLSSEAQPTTAKKNYIAQNYDSSNSEIFVVTLTAIESPVDVWCTVSWREVY